MRKEKSEHEKAKRVARKFLQAVRDHCSQKDDALQEMCNLEGADYNRVYSLIAFYVDEKDHSIRSNNLIAAYWLNDNGFKFSEIDFDFDFDFASRNANTKNEMAKETAGGSHKTWQIDNRPVNILSFQKNTFVQAQRDATHEEIRDSRRSSFWDFLPDVIKRLLGNL